jgi:hypothetical protein
MQVHKPSKWRSTDSNELMMFFIVNRFIFPEPDFPDQSQDLAPFLPDVLGGGVASAS